MTKNYTVQCNVFLFLFLLFIFPLSALSQDAITGKVLDDAGNPLPGVSVKVKDMESSASTDSEGRFSISSSNQETSLVFSYIGFVQKKVSLSKGTKISIDNLDGAKNVKPHHVLFPVPYEEIVKNSNLTQNPGYN